RHGATGLRPEPHALCRARLARHLLRVRQRALAPRPRRVGLRGHAVRRGAGRRVGDARPRVSRRVARRGTVAALLIGALIGGGPAAAAPPDARIPAVGFLPNEPTPDSLPVLRAGLREHAWIEGRSVEIQPRYAQGKPELYAQQAEELARLNVAVIVAVGVPAIEAARR